MLDSPQIQAIAEDATLPAEEPEVGSPPYAIPSTPMPDGPTNPTEVAVEDPTKVAVDINAKVALQDPSQVSMEGTVVVGDIQGRVEDASDAGTAAEGVRDASEVVEAPRHSDEVPDDSKGVTSADVVRAEAQQRRARKPPKSPPKVKTTYFLSQPSADVPTFRSKYPGIIHGIHGISDGNCFHVQGKTQKRESRSKVVTAAQKRDAGANKVSPSHFTASTVLCFIYSKENDGKLLVV